MTYSVRIRGAGGTMLVEYLCPIHGRFESNEPRANPPDYVACPAPVAGMWDNQCRFSSPWSPSRAPCVSIPIVSAGSHARDAERPHEGFMSTRALAEGQPLSEWKAERAQYWERERQKGAKEFK